MFANPYRRRGVALALLLGVCVAPVQAASLAEMLAAAAARNPGAETAQAQQRRADALQARAGQWLAAPPSVNLKYQTDQLGSDLGYREWEGGVDLPLRLPGQAGSYAREAEGVSAAARGLGDARRLELAGVLRERLWSLATARSDADQAHAALTLAQGLRDDVARRVAAGELPRSDRLLAEQEVLKRQEAALSADTRVNEAEQLFERFTGLTAPETPPVEQVLGPRTLQDSHPALRLAASQVLAARSHRDRVVSESRGGPSLWLGGKTARAASGADYESALGVEISMPLGARAYAGPDRADAEAALTDAQVAQARLRLSLQEQLAAAGLALDRVDAELPRTRQRRDLAEQTLALSRRAFDLGETDLVRLLQAQGMAIEARHDYQLRRLQHGQAVARLNQALGVIPQ